MRNLAAMLRVDLLNMRGMIISALIFAAMILTFIMLGLGSSAAPMMALLLMLAGNQLFMQDASGALPLLYQSLPTTRRTVVASHYLIAAGAFVIGTAMMFAAIALANLLGSDFGLKEGLMGASLTVILMAWILAFQIPLTVRFGQKSVFILILFVGAVATVGGFLFAHLEEGGSAIFESLGEAVWLNPVPAVLAAAGGAVVAWLISYFVSARIFERKNF